MKQTLALGWGVFLFCLFASFANATDKIEKEWTFLVFLNGHNNLDYFGGKDINEMEEVGSTDELNIVVQWASLDNGKTKRLYVTKDKNEDEVTSLPVEELAPVDMGDYHNLVKFIQWGAEKFPAKHYYVVVWNHGSGIWKSNRVGGFNPLDISFDDLTGNVITTQQLGQAMKEASASIGKKIDVYGSDACLMAMAEVADEMSDVVDVFVGSEELEPGAGWQYDTLLAEVAAKPRSTPKEFGAYTVASYIQAYSPGGQQRTDDVTLSSMDLSQMASFKASVKAFGEHLRTLSADEKNEVLSAASDAQHFYYSSYVDMKHMLNLYLSNTKNMRSKELATDLKAAAERLAYANGVTEGYKNAGGVSFWLPQSSYSASSYLEDYKKFRFSQDTGWGEVIGSLF